MPPEYPENYYGTAVTGTASTTIWLEWTANTTTATTSTQIWDQWTISPYIAPPAIPRQPPSPEETARRMKADQERLTKRELAKERAKKILVENLSDEQKAELEKEGHFHVETRDGQRKYRLRPGRPPIRVHGEDGRCWSYCIHPSGNFPSHDVALALKLMLETDEDRFLSVANASPA